VWLMNEANLPVFLFHFRYNVVLITISWQWGQHPYLGD